MRKASATKNGKVGKIKALPADAKTGTNEQPGQFTVYFNVKEKDEPYRRYTDFSESLIEARRLAETVKGHAIYTVGITSITMIPRDNIKNA